MLQNVWFVMARVCSGLRDVQKAVRGKLRNEIYLKSRRKKKKVWLLVENMHLISSCCHNRDKK